MRRLQYVDDLLYDEGKEILIFALYDKNGRTVKEICDKLCMNSKDINRWLHNYRKLEIAYMDAFTILYEIEDTEPERFQRALTRFKKLHGYE